MTSAINVAFVSAHEQSMITCLYIVLGACLKKSRNSTQLQYRWNAKHIFPMKVFALAIPGRPHNS
jgi:hypothetical protein